MEATTARAKTTAWGKTSRVVRAARLPFGHQLRPSLTANTIALLEQEAQSLSRRVVIGFAPTKHPSRIELQEWVNVNLVEPCMAISRIRMLQRRYFVLTFEKDEGATAALQQSPLTYVTHQMYLHPWQPQFNPTTPKAIKIPLWIRFPLLDDVYYKALREICSPIGVVVWSGKVEDCLKKSSTPRVCVLIENTRNLPTSIILPIPGSTEEVEIFLKYENIPHQCSGCLEIGHAAESCPNQRNFKLKGTKKQPQQKPPTK